MAFKKPEWKRAILIILCLALIFALRNFIALALVPALFCWWLSTRINSNRLLTFASVYIAGLFLFFSIKVLLPALDFPAYIAQKQLEFSQLEGTSTVIKQPLEPTFVGFVKFFPYAVDMAFLRPHLTEAKSLAYIPAALENILLVIIIIVSIFVKDKKTATREEVLFCLFFATSILLLSGYTITLSGAIVRYRSIALPLIITPLLCMINYQTIMRRFTRRIK